MNEIVNISSKEEFKKELNTNIPVVVDFFATWCAPCRMQAPILHEFKEELGDKIKVLKVDVDEVESLAVEYSVSSIPTIIIFKDGEAKEKAVGLSPKSRLSDLVIKYL